MATRIQLRRGTAAEWTSANPTLSAGEPGFETDTGKLKLGNGVSAWKSLPYITVSADQVTGLQAVVDAAVASALASQGGGGGGGVADTTAPLISSFSATPGNAQMSLAWAATDNVAVTRYTVTRGGTQLYSGTGTSYVEGSLTNGTAYTWVLTARDAAGNTKTASVTATPVAGTTGSAGLYAASYPATY